MPGLDPGIHARGKVRSFDVPNVTAKTLRPIIATHASKASALNSDEAPIYKNFRDHFASHESVNHQNGEYVRGETHTNTVEGFFSLLKRGHLRCLPLGERAALAPLLGGV